MPYKPTGKPPGRPKKTPKPGDRPPLSEKAWKALKFKDENPTATHADIARAVGVSRSQVTQWEKDDWFQLGRHWLWGQEVNRRLDQKDRERRKQTEEAARKRIGSREYTLDLLYFDIKRDVADKAAKGEPWSVQSMVDGQVYTDPNAYYAHIKAAGVTYVGHLSDKDWQDK